MIFDDFQLFSTALNGLCGLHDYPTHAQVWWCRLSRSAQSFYLFYFIIPPHPWCLCLVKTGLFACKPCLKYSRIHGTKVQSCIECVKGQWLSMVFDGFQQFSMVFNDFRLFSMVLNGLCGLHDYPTHSQVWWCHLSRSAQSFYFIYLFIIIIIILLVLPAHSVLNLFPGLTGLTCSLSTDNL